MDVEETLLHLAVEKKKQLDIVEYLLCRKDTNRVNVCDKYGSSPIWNGSKNENCNLVKLMIENGAEVNPKNSELSPLSYGFKKTGP